MKMYELCIRFHLSLFLRFRLTISQHWFKLEQLERLRSEDTPDAPWLPHTIDQFILNPNSILMTSSYQIPSQNKVKAEKLENLRKIEILEFCYKLNTRHTF